VDAAGGQAKPVEVRPSGDVSAPVEEPKNAGSSNEAKPAPQEKEVGASQPKGSGEPKVGEDITRASTESGRAGYGLPEARKTARKEFGKSWDEAQAELARNPKYAENIVDRLSKRPQALGDKEHAALLDQHIQAQNEASRPHSAPSAV